MGIPREATRRVQHRRRAGRLPLCGVRPLDGHRTAEGALPVEARRLRPAAGVRFDALLSWYALTRLTFVSSASLNVQSPDGETHSFRAAGYSLARLRSS